VPNSVEAPEFETFFRQFGDVFSTKLNQFDKSEGGTGYGYVQFENKDSV
jgi:RNA recognition motif-containing protein